MPHKSFLSKLGVAHKAPQTDQDTFLVAPSPEAPVEVSPPLSVYPRTICEECNADGYRMGSATRSPIGHVRWECPRCKVGWAVPPEQKPPSIDPRSDLTHDSIPWIIILTATKGIDGDKPDGLYGALHGMRCMATKLAWERNPDTQVYQWRLIKSDEVSNEEWADWRRRYLFHHVAMLTKFLTHIPAPVGTSE